MTITRDLRFLELVAGGIALAITLGPLVPYAMLG